MLIKTLDTDLAAQTSPSGTASAGLVTSQVKIVAQAGVVSQVHDRHRLKTNKIIFENLFSKYKPSSDLQSDWSQLP